MTIRVPKEFEEEFKNLLDMAQAEFGIRPNLSSKEKKVIKFVRKIVGDCSDMTHDSRGRQVFVKKPVSMIKSAKVCNTCKFKDHDTQCIMQIQLETCPRKKKLWG